MLKYQLSFLFLPLTMGWLNAQIPSGTQLLPEGLKSFTTFGSETPKSILKEVVVTGQSFSKALMFTTFIKDKSSGDYGLTANIKTSLRQGDVLWISFKARCLESNNESGEAYLGVRLDQLVNGQFAWPPNFERGVSVGSNWVETSFPFVMKKNASPEELRLIIQFDKYAQKVELGDITFLNYGTDVPLSSLKRTVITYDGQEPDAAWRKGAEERINKYRKADLVIKVVNKTENRLKMWTFRLK